MPGLPRDINHAASFVDQQRDEVVAQVVGAGVLYTRDRTCGVPCVPMPRLPSAVIPNATGAVWEQKVVVAIVVAAKPPPGQVGGERRKPMSLASESVPTGMRRSDHPQPALGEAIRQLRQKRGVTQEDLAHDADITTGTLSLIERGHANPTWGTLKGITAALGVSMGDVGRLADKLDK